MDGQIRKATEKDVALLANLIRTSFKDVAARFHLSKDNCPTHPSQCTPEWIKTAFIKGVEYFILTQYSEPIGCVALQRANREVYYMERWAVLPEYRDQGCGRMLVEFCLQLSKKRRAKRVEAGIIADQRELLEWYRRLGFRFKQQARLHHLPFSVAFLYCDLLEEWVYEAEPA